jgi:hypothetical protein
MSILWGSRIHLFGCNKSNLILHKAALTALCTKICHNLAIYLLGNICLINLKVNSNVPYYDFLGIFAYDSLDHMMHIF